MSAAEPLSPEERERRQTMLAHAERWLIGGASGLIDRWEATVQAAEAEREDWMRRGLAAVERAEAAEAADAGLRAAIRDARGLMDEAHREDRPGMAHHYRISADKILSDTLAAHPSPGGEA